MPRHSRVRPGIAASVALLGLGVPTLAIATVAGPAHAAAPVTVNLLNINDFHGRIDANTTKFATTIEQLRAAAGEANTLFLSAGDNIGASLFASSVQQDTPTLRVLDALDLATSAVGNHEFDRGADDLTGRVSDTADFDYLGANVYRTGTTTPVLPEYRTFEVAGVTVGVIGVVTQETPTLVSPAGVAGLTFGDPVAAVNRVATKLSDGDAANGEADVLVAEYHEGAGAGTPDGATLEQEVAAGGAFADIVEKTSPLVDAIFTGHTHKEYAWDAPVPGQPGRTRPVLQTGSYGENIGQIELSVDPDTGQVASYTSRNVPRASTEDLTFPRVAAVKTITDAALANAAAVGNTPVGSIADDITTAYSGGGYTADGYTGGTRDDRSRESALGDLVADALRDGVRDFATPDLGITNSGGLRAELFYAGDVTSNPANTDGVVTYAEANAVLPFNNTVALVKLTGEQLRAVLEQQWQPAGSSRPYLQLGLSDNVRVTADPTAPAGSRITSVRIDGALLDPARIYTVSTLSFLAAGGDNFTAFADGDAVDTGLLDAQLWRDYLADHPSLAPDFARQQVFATGLPTAVTAGAPITGTIGIGETAAPVFPINAKTLDLTSLGAPSTTALRPYLVKGRQVIELPEVAVTDGIATLDLTAPADLAGTWQFGAVAVPTGTVVGAELPGDATSSILVGVQPATIRADRSRVTVRVRVTGDGEPATGKVVIRGNGKERTVRLVQGRAKVAIGRYATPGVKRIVVRYLGSDTVEPGRLVVKVKVRR